MNLSVIKASSWNIIMDAMIRHLSHAVMKWWKPICWMYGCLSKLLTSLQARQGGNSSAWGSNLVLVNDDSRVMVHWSVGGYLRGLSVWYWVLFGTLHHTAAQRRTRRKAGQAKVRTKLTGSMVGETWIYALKQMHIFYIHKQIDRHTPSRQPAPQWADGYFRKEHSVRTHVAFSSAPFRRSPCSLLSLWPSLSLLLCSLISVSAHHFQPVSNLDPIPNPPTLFESLLWLFPSPCRRYTRVLLFRWGYG